MPECCTCILIPRVFPNVLPLLRLLSPLLAGLLWELPKAATLHCIKWLAEPHDCDAGGPGCDRAHTCCRKAHINRTLDKELVYLKIYLLKIAGLDSLAGLQHKKWERYIAEDLRNVRGSHQ